MITTTQTFTTDNTISPCGGVFELPLDPISTIQPGVYVHPDPYTNLRSAISLALRDGIRKEEIEDMIKDVMTEEVIDS